MLLQAKRIMEIDALPSLTLRVRPVRRREHGRQGAWRRCPSVQGAILQRPRALPDTCQPRPQRRSTEVSRFDRDLILPTQG